MNRIIFCLTLFVLVACTYGHSELLASGLVEKVTKGQNSRSGFIENKGQIVDQEYNPNPAVLYLLNTPGMNVQVRRGGFSYDVYQVIDKETQYHRIDIDLRNFNPDYTIDTSESNPAYLNYHTTGTPPFGCNFVRSYKSVSFRNVYWGIDLVFCSTPDRGFKYNFIVHPGGNVKDIQLQLKGCPVTLTSSGTLLMNTVHGAIEESIPASYAQSGGRELPVNVKFTEISENVFGILVKDVVPPGSVLVIDPVPELDWGTYFGGNAEDHASETSVDQSGNVYICGYTYSSGNIATSGAYQTVCNGSSDAFLSKFSTDGLLLWSTYYGGSLVDQALACFIDADGDVIIGGTTLSPTNISTPGAFKINISANNDSFIAKFSSSGSIEWGTYYGGDNMDEVEGVAADDQKNIYVSGSTLSSNNISSPGAFQTTIYPCISGDCYDWFLVKFTPAGNRVWGTYYGGDNADYSCTCAADHAGHVVLFGTTQSSQNVFSPGAYQTALNSPQDDLIALFDSTGQRLWGTYFGGNGLEESHKCTFSPDNTIYVTGTTYSSLKIASPGSYQSSLHGSIDAFVASFSLSGTRNWSTYYGGSANDEGWGITTNIQGDVFISGYTKSSDYMATADAPQSSLGGNSDAFLAKFNSSGNRVWGTYYGGVNFESGTSCSVDQYNNEYMTGVTASLNNIATTGAYQEIFGGGYNDAFLVKFSTCQQPGDPSGLSGPAEVCQSTSGIVYSVLLQTGVTGYTWSMPPGVIIVNGSNTNQVTVDFGSTAVSGYLTVHAFNSCAESNNDSLWINIHARPIPVISGPDTVCYGVSYIYSTAPGNALYQWNITGGTILSGSGTNNVTVSWNTLGSQSIQVNYTDLNSCEGLVATQKVIIVDPTPAAGVSISASANNICAGIPVTFSANPTNPGANPVYLWKVNGVNSGTNSSTFVYTPLDNDIVSCMLTSSFICTSNNPATSNAIVMIVNPVLAVSITTTASQNPFCSGSSVTFTATPVNGGPTAAYQWKVNGFNVGINSTTYTYFPANGDQVQCILTSSEPCTTGNPASSITITMVETFSLPASVSITPLSNPFCPGSSVTFTAIPINGGAPNYQWKVNGINVGINSNTYTYNPANGDSVRVVMTSDLPCVTGSPASSAKIIMTANPAPVVTFTSCFDTITTLNAKPIKLRGGIPLGGVYSGPGVNSGTGYFNPALAGVGTKTITYSYTNAALCIANASVTLVTLVTSVTTCGTNLTDPRDNRVYTTVQIGSQCWLAEDLNYGTTVPNSQDQRDNCIAEKYKNPFSILNPPSSTYQWDEVMQYDETPASQGFCPPGWHIPSENDWNILFTNYISSAFAGSPLKYSGYSGFNALLSGVRHINKGWDLQGFATFFWSSIPRSESKAWAHGMNEIDPSVSLYPALRVDAFPVRCLRD